MATGQTALEPESLAGAEAARLVVVEWIGSAWRDLVPWVTTTVTTEAEYAALPIGTVVRGNQHGQVAERVDEEGGSYRWVYTGYSAGFSAFEHKTIARDLGTATVLYVPAIP